MKQLMIWPLIMIFCCQSAIFAQTFDKEKLLTLKPLCSEMINKLSSDFKSNHLSAIGATQSYIDSVNNGAVSNIVLGLCDY